MRLFPIITTITLIGLLTACAGARFDVGHTETALPRNLAWVDGHKVEYVTTDISDATMAKMAGVNFVPRLANAINHDNTKSVLDRVYKFPAGEQISIFQSAPEPTGGENADINYSPLWRLVLVNWIKQDKIHELKSEADLLVAEDRGELSLQVSHIVVNCPVTRGKDGRALKGVR